MEYFIYHFEAFLLIMARMLGLFMTAPFFSSQAIKFSQRALLAFLVTTIAYPVVEQYRFEVPGHIMAYGLAAFGEAVIGILIGFIVSLTMAAFQMAGQFFSIQMGFGMSEVMDPMSQSTLPIIGTLYNLFGLLIFLIIGGHFMLIKAVIYSYQKIGLFIPQAAINANLMAIFESGFGAMFLIALKIALPLIGTLFLMSVMMGLISKAAPQMNILMMGFPVNIMLAFSIILMMAPLISGIMQDSFYLIFDKIDELQRAWPVG